MAEVHGGASWLWFDQRLAGLPITATWPDWRRHRPPPPLTAAATDSFLESL